MRDDDFVFGYRSDVFGLSSDYRRIVFLLAEAFREFPLKSWAGAVFGEVGGSLDLLRALEMTFHM